MDAVTEQRECTMVPGPNGATGGTRGGVAPGNTGWKHGLETRAGNFSRVPAWGLKAVFGIIYGKIAKALIYHSLSIAFLACSALGRATPPHHRAPVTSLPGTRHLSLVPHRSQEVVSWHCITARRTPKFR
jgi:hypothetical protein